MTVDDQRTRKTRIGAVRYLNAKPLTDALPRLAPQAAVSFDLPSRLADSIEAGRLDIAMLPSIEYFRHRDYTIVSDACIACEGPVRSVKLFTRVPLERIESLALDVGSRTSAALVQILLKEQFALEPQLEPLPIGARLDTLATDAVMLIGDRGMQMSPPGFDRAFDLGQMWTDWTGLPFVFAMWIARPDVDAPGLAETLAAARDAGVARIDEIARREAPRLGLSEAECLGYLRNALTFHLGPRQREGLTRFYELAVEHGLAPRGVDLVFCPAPVDR